MSTEKIIKAQAKSKLKQGGWEKALYALALVVIFYMLIECIASIPLYAVDVLQPDKTMEFIIEVASGTVTTIVALLISPILLGFFRMFLSDDKEYFMGDVLYYFSGIKHYNKAIKFMLSFILRMFLPTVLYFLLPVALYTSHYLITDGEAMGTALKICFILSIILAVLLTLRHSIRYFVSVLLLCKSEFEGTAYYFNTSKQIMKKHEKDIMKLFWSFIWWILLSITGLPALYTIPYITQAFCISGKWLTELQRNGQEL